MEQVGMVEFRCRSRLGIARYRQPRNSVQRLRRPLRFELRHRRMGRPVSQRAWLGWSWRRWWVGRWSLWRRRLWWWRVPALAPVLRAEIRRGEMERIETNPLRYSGGSKMSLGDWNRLRQFFLFVL